jgi:hypothetical protein
MMRQNLGGDNFSESVTETPNIQSVFNATANDSDKIFVVPDNETWKINHANVILATTATVGNRALHMDMYDADGNEIVSIAAGVVQAASLVVSYSFLQGIFRETATVNGNLQVPIPQDMYLTGGMSLRFYDASAIAAAADDMTVAFQYKKMVV